MIIMFFSSKSSKTKKAQIKVEFIFSVLFFSMVIFFVGVELNRILSSSIQDSSLDSLKSQANSMLDILVGEGEPKNWENNPPAAKRIGLGSPAYNLSVAKINALKNNCTLVDEKFGVSSYALIIDTTQELLSCGYGGPKIRSVAERSVYVEGKYGKIILELW